MFLRDRVCREAEGGASAPPVPVAAPVVPAAAAAQPTETVANLRAERAAESIARRTAEERATTLQRQLDESSAAQAAALELARTQATAPLQTRLQRLEASTIEAVLAAEAQAAGLADPDLLGLRDRMPDAPAVTVDEQGRVVGAKELVAKFKTWKPEFFRAAAGQPGPGGRQHVPPPPPPPASGTQITTVRGMTKDQYATWKRDQLRAMRTS